MALPQHSDHVPEPRAARAPYNFVPLPDQVVRAEDLPSHDRYYPSHGETPRYTGELACTLTAASPLYVRCGYTPEQYAALAEKPFEQMTDDEKRLRAQFFSFGDPNAPAIPGSSLRGMLRALVEIAAYGKMEKVTDRQRYFFRAVAAKTDDPLARPYRDLLRNVKAGYLAYRDGAWLVHPARPIGGEPYLKAREQDIPPALGLVRLNESSYHLQTLPVSFTTKKLRPSPRNPQGRLVIDLIGPPGTHAEPGWIVTSGNMLETGAGWQRSPRKNHAVIGAAGPGELAIAAEAVDDYRSSLTPFQVEQLGPDGVLQHGRPIFYCEPARGEPVRFFGHSPNFRIPFWQAETKRAATPADFVPGDLKAPSVIDIAEAIFGFVRPKRQEQGVQAVAGRVFVGDALLQPGQTGVLFEAPLTPQILGTPKPTTFQHYLVQTETERRQTGVDQRGRPIYQLPLAHYGSATPEETVVRGHKLYWHQGQHPEIGLPPEQADVSESQKTLIRPVRPGTIFSFTVRFENLSRVELGALLWVLRLAADERYRLKLGMGKPLGMGAVKIVPELRLSDRAGRYQALFDDVGWSERTRAAAPDEQRSFVDEFERHVLKQSGERAERLEDTLRIRCLLVLLAWPGPIPEQTRYMQIEYGAGKVNEYKDRPVLPSPLQVAGVEAPAGEVATTTPARPAPPTPPKPAGPRLPAVGDVFAGLVLERGEQSIAVEVPGFPPDKALGVLRVEADTPKWVPGKDRARVEVIGVRQQGQRTILDLKRGPKAEKK